MTSLPVAVELSSDLLDRKTPIFRDDTIFISQSGETADTLAALVHCKKRGAICVGIVNTVTSAIARLTDCGVYINAGPEISVASTKACTSQIIALVLVSLQLGQDKVSLADRIKEVIEGLENITSNVQKVLNLEDNIRKYAALFVEKHCESSCLIIGRGYQLSTALEAALKIKENTCFHEGMQAGELKHGTLALVTAKMPIMMIATKDNVYEQVQNALHQIVARKGAPFVVCSEADEFILKGREQYLDILEVPVTCDVLQTVINLIPFQLLAYHMAILRGNNVDTPR